MNPRFILRDLPVWSSDRAVIAHVHKKLEKVSRTRAHREARHAFIRDALDHHHNAQALCAHFRM